MKDLSNSRWGDFSARYRNYACPFCNRQGLNFSKPKHNSFFDESGIISVACQNCGHIVLFDVATVISIAEDIDKEYRDKGWR